MNPDESAQPNPGRPNAKYNLSKADPQGPVSEEDLIFYYNREDRLAKAPSSVRELYTEKQSKKSRFNLLRPLISSKPGAMLFVSILILSFTIIFLNLSGRLDTSYIIDGNQISVEAVRYEDTVIMHIIKTYRRGTNLAEVYTGAIDVAVSPIVTPGEEYPVFYHRIYFSLAVEEEYRFVVPFNSSQLGLVLQSENSTLQITVNPQ